MGVLGLTTFIDKMPCFEDFKLQNTNVVIDANNLCAQIYRFSMRACDLYGGEYNVYYRFVKTFFTNLQMCKVSPIVLFDGGYETRKCKTIFNRMRSRMEAVERLSKGEKVYPLLLREAFMNIVKELQLNFMRCEFEADYDIAVLARSLNCPVMSFDSDFFVLDVVYLPLTMVGNVAQHRDTGERYLECQSFKRATFLQMTNLQKIHLPVLAVILGNDFITRGSLHKFYMTIGAHNCDSTTSFICAVLSWLAQQTFETAVASLLERVPPSDRALVAEEIDHVASVYSMSCRPFLTAHLRNLGSLRPPSRLDKSLFKVSAASFLDVADLKASKRRVEVDPITRAIIQTKRNPHPLVEDEWFLTQLATGKFPSFFMDILTMNVYICTPQVENIRNQYTVQVHMPIILAVAKILLGPRSDGFRCVTRDCQPLLRLLDCPLPADITITLADVRAFSTKQCHDAFFSILRFGDAHKRCLAAMPVEWRLYLAVQLYWFSRAKEPQITPLHLCAVLLSLLELYIVHKKVFAARDKHRPTGDFAPPNFAYMHSILKYISMDECHVFHKTFESFFTPKKSIKPKSKNFEILVVDAFAQMQNCLLAIKHLNALLQYPLQDFNICRYYNGTFVYNVFCYLKKYPAPMPRIRRMTMRCPTIWALLSYLFEKLTPFIGDICADLQLLKL